MDGEWPEATTPPTFTTVLFRSIRPSHITRQVDMAEIRLLSQVTEALATVKKPLVKKAKIHFFFSSHMGSSGSQLSELNFT